LQGHKGSIEDLQWSPTQANVIASCSSDKTIKLWDLRATQMKPMRSWVAHDCDVNVISWNPEIKFLLASGDDKGEFRIWDLRMLTEKSAKEAESITRIRWHTKAITSLSFEPRQDSTLAVASADNKLTMWDFSVEIDESETVTDQDIEVPPQLMFLH
jgi:ribosome assembly protein RRB1